MPATVEQAIHARWAESPSLLALLPVERVSTGLAHGGSLPYATITREKCRTLCRTNAGDALDEILLRIDVWHDCYDAGRAILDAVIAAFDRSRFGLSGESRVTRMCRSDDFALQHGDGLWQFSVFFSLQAYLASGV